MRRWVVIAAGVVLVAVVGFLLFRKLDGGWSSNPVANGASPSKSVPGFDQVGFQVGGGSAVTTGAGTRHCALLALTRDQQDRGLMNRTDLAGYDGMIFHFPDPTTTQFYMKDTLIPLSIAWFDASGRFVSQTDMPPCPPASVCPLFAAAGPYTDAVEVLQGRLSSIGIGPGSTLAVGGAC